MTLKVLLAGAFAFIFVGILTLALCKNMTRQIISLKKKGQTKVDSSMQLISLCIL